MTAPILYSFRRCPYAMRARWTVLHAGLLVELREVALRSKPAALLDVSPKATVPVLITPEGTVVDESLAVMDWALAQADPCDWRGASLSDQQRATIAALIAENDGAFKHHLDRFKYTDRYPGAIREQHRQQGEMILSSWAHRLASTGWLVAGRCTLADVALWPFVRQWSIADPEGFAQAPEWAPLRNWLQGFLKAPAFERLMQRREPWQQGDQPVFFPGDAASVPKDQPLFHLALADDWRQAQIAGDYAISTRGLRVADVGFLHASTAEQVPGTFQRFYSDAAEVLKLTIDPQRLPMPLRADPVPGGQLFPHVYGTLPLDAVTAVSAYPQSA